LHRPGKKFPVRPELCIANPLLVWICDRRTNRILFFQRP
jgi:hypothetical protein